MSTFEYRGFDGEGRAVSGLIEALDTKEARERLRVMGVLAEQVAGVTAGARRRRRLTLADRAVFYRELGALLKAGLPLARAMQVLIESPESGPLRFHLAFIRDRVAEGAALSNVMAERMPEVAAFEITALKAAEKTGGLSVALEYLADFLEEQERIRDKIASALIYPSIVMVAAVLIGAGTLTVLVPRIGFVLQEAGIAQPALTRGVIAVGRVLPWLAGVVLLAGAGVGIFLHGRSELRESARRRLEWILGSLPFLRRVRDVLAGFRFAHTLSLLLRGGVPLIDAALLAGRATGRYDVSEGVESGVEKVRQGETLAASLRCVPALSQTVVGWIEAGEASGQLESLLKHAAARLQRQWERQVNRWMSLLEPILTLFVSAVVLLVALAVLLPILNVTKAL